MEVESKTITTEDYEELLQLATTVNNLEFNTMKVLEEMHELGVLLIKSLTKVEAFRPPKKDIIEEVGDLLARLNIYVHQMDIEEATLDRCESKLSFLLSEYRTRKYGTTVKIERTMY